MMKIIKRISVLTLAILMILMSFAGCSKKEETVGMENPWHDAETGLAAAEGAGIEELVIKDGTQLSLGEVKVSKWRYMEGMVEAEVEFPASMLTIRKGVKDLAEDGDISGDYNTYKNNWTQGINAIDVECSGNKEDTATKTTFTTDNFAYSIVATALGGEEDFGLTIDDLALLVEGIDGVTLSAGMGALEPGNYYGYAGNDPNELAVYTYLADEVAKNYDKADCSIPVVTIIDVDDSNPEDVKIKGDYWVWNYNIEGDTLKCVSGGAHPGCLHIKLNDNGTYEVLGFDAVKDGGEYDSSAQEIFGDKYEEFKKVAADDETRETNRYDSISMYVNANEIPVTQYQDEGQEPVGLHL